MSLTTSEMTPADIAAITERDGDGMWGGQWGMWIILFLIFGMFGFGRGGLFGTGDVGGALTRGELCQDMNFQQLENATRGIQQGLCDGFYAMNTGMLNGFHGVDNAICNLGYQTQQGFNATNMALMQGQNALQAQLADCCCETQRGIDSINYNMATNSCAIQNTIQNSTRDIIDNQNANSRAILDYLCQDKIQTLQQENQALRLTVSQTNQNAVLKAAMDANTAEIIRRTGNDCPIPAYVVPNPNCCYNYGCGNGFAA